MPCKLLALVGTPIAICGQTTWRTVATRIFAPPFVFPESSRSSLNELDFLCLPKSSAGTQICKHVFRCSMKTAWIAIRPCDEHGALKRSKNHPRTLARRFLEQEGSGSTTVQKHGSEPALVHIEELL